MPYTFEPHFPCAVLQTILTQSYLHDIVKYWQQTEHTGTNRPSVSSAGRKESNGFLQGEENGLDVSVSSITDTMRPIVFKCRAEGMPPDWDVFLG